MSNENQNSFKNFSHQQDGEKQLDTGTPSASFKAAAEVLAAHFFDVALRLG